MAYIDSCGVKYSDDKKILEKCPTEFSGSYTIIDDTKTISKYAFQDCKNLDSLIIPSSVDKIELLAFSGCSKLEKIVYQGSLSEWLCIKWDGSFATAYDLFIGGNKIESVAIPSSINAISPYCFYYCRSIKEIILHNAIKSIGANAFNKSCLKGEIKLPASLTNVGRLAFFCTNISTLSIPANTSVIENGAFSNCVKLTKIICDENNVFYGERNGFLYRKKDLLVIAISHPYNTFWSMDLPPFFKGFEEQSAVFDSIPRYGINVKHKLSQIKKGAFRDSSGIIYVNPGEKAYNVSLGIPFENIKEKFFQESCLKQNHSFISAIVNNPFRILGSFTNSTTRELSANATKIKRYLEVGKQITFPSDMNTILPPMVRTIEMVDEALAKISQPLDKLKHSMFWFSNVDNESDLLIQKLYTDPTALNNLNLKSEECINSLERGQIVSIAQILNGNYDKGIIMLHTLLFGDNDDLKTKVFENEFFEKKEHFIKSFIDLLIEDIKPLDLFIFIGQKRLNSVAYQYLFDICKTSYISIINSAIKKAEQIDSDNPEILLSTANNLKRTTYLELIGFRSLCIDGSTKDIKPGLSGVSATWNFDFKMQYQIAADKVAGQLRDSIIDYYNKSLDRYAAEPSLDIIQYAYDIAIGETTKSQCKEDIDTLRSRIEKLPPKDIRPLLDLLDTIISKYESGESYKNNEDALLVYCSSTLLQIKEKTGLKNSFYINCSTNLISIVLSNIIKSVNEAIKNDNITPGQGRYSLKPRELWPSRRALEETVKRAWLTTLHMDRFDMEADFKTNRYTPNRQKLKDIVCDLFNMSSEPNVIWNTRTMGNISPIRIDMRTEWEYYSDSCKTSTGLRAYLEKYPHGKYGDIARKNIPILEAKEDSAYFHKCKTKIDYQNYINKYPNGQFVTSASAEIKRLQGIEEKKIFETCSSIEDYKQYCYKYPNGIFKEAAIGKIDDLTWECVNSIEKSKDYIKNFPEGRHLSEAMNKISNIRSLYGWVACESILIILMSYYFWEIQGIIIGILVLAIIVIIPYVLSSNSPKAK